MIYQKKAACCKPKMLCCLDGRTRCDKIRYYTSTAQQRNTGNSTLPSVIWSSQLVSVTREQSAFHGLCRISWSLVRMATVTFIPYPAGASHSSLGLDRDVLARAWGFSKVLFLCKLQCAACLCPQAVCGCSSPHNSVTVLLRTNVASHKLLSDCCNAFSRTKMPPSTEKLPKM